MSWKIYFAGSIRGGRDDAALYAEIIKNLQSFGKVFTEHVGDSNVIEKGELSTQKRSQPVSKFSN